MKLSKSQRSLLKLYLRLRGESHGAGWRLLGNIHRILLCPTFALVVAVLIWLLLGNSLERLENMVVPFWMLLLTFWFSASVAIAALTYRSFRLWPVIREVIDWDRLKQLLEENSGD